MRHARQWAGICLPFLLAASVLGAKGKGQVGAFMTKLDGTKEVYLTTADAAKNVCGWRQARDGASVTGAPLRIGSVTFRRGIGTHAPAELVFELGGKYQWLTCYAGISDEMTQDGSAILQVWLDGRKVHETPVLRIKHEPVYLCLPVKGAKELKLIGTDAGNGNGADHLCLGNLRLCPGEKEPAPDAPKPSRPAKPVRITPLSDLSDVMPAHGTASVVPARKWEDAFVSGNGRLGAMVFGDPVRDTIVGNHCRLFLPLGSREIVPDLAKYVPELRQIIRTKGYGAAMKFFLGKAKEQGFPGLIWTDPFHPGFFLTVEQPPSGDVTNYVRTEDFSTGEVTVRWKDDVGAWSRRLFVSRPDNAIALAIDGPSAGKVSCTLRPELVGESRIVSTRKVEAGWATYHNVYQYGKGGFDVAIRVAASGGKTSGDDESIHVEGADRVLVLMRIAPWKIPAKDGDAWAYNPKHPDFAADKLGAYPAAPAGADSSVTAYQTNDNAKALLPKVKAALAGVPADYDLLLEKHAKVHRALFDRVTLDLGGGADRGKTSEQLLDIAQKEQCLPAALLEKMFDAGRYMFICSAGERTPNLQGIWTGSWKPAWSGDYTTDTNVQLAIKVAYPGNLPELMEGYYRLMEEALPDWRLNAGRYYGCRGVLAPTRMSNNGLMLHWGGWDGIWWTAGASWLAHFFTDNYHYTGDREFLAHRVVPLLKEVVAFYEDYLTVDPKTSLYEFIPSYSPESGDGITSTMDVMVAREALSSLIEACETLKIEPAGVARWKAMLAKLPAYRVNKDGALAEWVPEGYGEHYRHRHLSHLHAAYEANGELLNASPEIWRAAQEATRRRIHSGGEKSTHGRMHMGLAAAHLHMAEEAYGRLAIMATLRSIFPSLICGHEPGPRIFNTDGNGAIPEILCRMLLASRPGRLDLLPALPTELPKGQIRGILARQAIHVEKLSWNKPAGTVSLWLTSSTDQTITLHLPGAKAIRSIEARGATVKDSSAGPLARELTLQAGQPAQIRVAFE